MREAIRQAKILGVLNHPESPCRLWRNNVGVLKDTRGIPVRYGLAVGSADLVGIVMHTGQFIAVEVKTDKGRLSPEQKAWLGTIKRFGGYACVLRTPEEAELVVKHLRTMPAMCLLHTECVESREMGALCAQERTKKAA